MDDMTMTATFVPSPEFQKILDELSVAKVEYVVEDPIFIEAITKSGETMRYPTAVREHIVRCRDCASYRPGGKSHAPRCEKSIGTFVPNPNGFCAWGERGE